MKHSISRRSFLSTTAVAGMSLFAPPGFVAEPSHLPRKKSLIGVPTAALLERHKAAGFQGLEATDWSIAPDAAAKLRATAQQLDMRIHSVLRGWTDFNSPHAAQVEKDMASVETALVAAQAYGADAVLLVPCRLLDDVAVPKPEDFAIELDEPTGHVTRVVAGDNTAYAPYMQAQNRAIDMSRKALDKLLPVAEKTGVVIALENVWSNLWVQPALFAHFVRSFQSRWIQTYFDIGNHVKYAPPEAWIESLGQTIVKLHVKDFTIDRAAPQGGQFVDIRDGQVNWPAVIEALDRVGYRGWLTIEGSGGLSLDEQSRRLDLILAGK